MPRIPISDLAEARRLLSVDATASEDELKKAYRRAMKRWHPDVAAPDSGLHAAAHRQTQRLSAAYRLLVDHPGPESATAPTSGGWRGQPIRTIRSTSWLARVITSDRTPIGLGVLVFVGVWAVLAGLAGALETFVLP